MKLSLDSIGYGGYFTAPGEQSTLEDSMHRAENALFIAAKRDHGFRLYSRFI